MKSLRKNAKEGSKKKVKKTKGLPGINNNERIDLKQYNLELDESMAQIKNGEVFSHETVLKLAKNW